MAVPGPISPVLPRWNLEWRHHRIRTLIDNFLGLSDLVVADLVVVDDVQTDHRVVRVIMHLETHLSP